MKQMRTTGVRNWYMVIDCFLKKPVVRVKSDLSTWTLNLQHEPNPADLCVQSGCRVFLRVFFRNCRSLNVCLHSREKWCSFCLIPMLIVYKIFPLAYFHLICRRFFIHIKSYTRNALKHSGYIIRIIRFDASLYLFYKTGLSRDSWTVSVFAVMNV